MVFQQGKEGWGKQLSPLSLPLELESVFIVQAWHPRLDRDPAHQWLRHTIKQYFLNRE
ncbi:hypothetical protein PROSTU_04257 [Providencia stuartii ATCC 25827]|uniref:LysR substrate-binding domain-containing protein n=1 Tax=Providencia stuartii ATCC 25827 TaxID=471874 RepID=A0AA86YF83_PROST|nr:hypothetical protein PROSTU_04257 [Providencia stuartii ATCC 25827]